LFKKFLRDVIYHEIVPTIPMPEDELMAFAKAVEDRFSNPYIRHNLLDISLNSCSKFLTRCLPSILSYIEIKKKLPKLLIFSMVGLIKFYDVKEKDGSYVGKREDGTEYIVKDDLEALKFFEAVWKSRDPQKISHDVLANEALWGGRNLLGIEGLEQSSAKLLQAFGDTSIRESLIKYMEEDLGLRGIG